MPKIVRQPDELGYAVGQRREALFEQLRDGPAQVWITGTEAAPFDAILGEASCWRVVDGVVKLAG